MQEVVQEVYFVANRGMGGPPLSLMSSQNKHTLYFFVHLFFYFSLFSYLIFYLFLSSPLVCPFVLFFFIFHFISSLFLEKMVSQLAQASPLVARVLIPLAMNFVTMRGGLYGSCYHT